MEEALPLESSTGATELLDGALACPPEDGRSGYAKLVSADPRRAAERAEALRHARGSSNWRDAGVRGPDDFDLAARRAALADALRSRLSAPGGQKVLVTSLAGGARPEWREELPGRRDASVVAVCAGCGSPAAALRCGGCRETFYCGRECQRRDWKAGHKAACAGRGWRRRRLIMLTTRITGRDSDHCPRLGSLAAMMRIISAPRPLLA